MTDINIFTDGSCIKGSETNYGGIGVHIDNDKIRDISRSYCDSSVTNQRMELTACIKGIEKVINHMKKKQLLYRLVVYTDSMYSIKCATEWGSKWIMYNWKRKVNSKFKDISNLDLIKRLYSLSCLYHVTYKHVRGHQPKPDKTSSGWYTWNGNDIADKLAGGASNKASNKVDN